MKPRYSQLLVCLGTGLFLLALVWLSISSVQATDYLETIVDINPDTASSYPKFLTVYGDELYFQADDGTHGKELWSYDGTTALLAVDIQSGSAAGDPRDLIVYDGTLFFSAVDAAHGRELWAYDGVTATLVHDFNPGSANGSPTAPVVYANALFFAANDGVDGSELCFYDGVTVTQVADINPVFSNLGPSHLSVYDGVLYFRADDGVHGQELWSYDGVTTTLVSDIYTGTGSGNPGHFAIWQGDLFFGAQDASYQYHLYRYDGSEVTRVGTETYTNPGPEYLTVYDGALYFKNTMGTYGYEIWRYAGGSPERVTDINPGSGSASPNYLTDFAGKLYFYAYDPTYGYELWSFHDGSADFELNINTNAGTASSYPSEFTPLGDRLYFRADDGFKGHELTYIIPTPLLETVMAASHSLVEPGQRLTYTLVVEHPGGKPLSNVTISDTLPAGLSFAGPVTLTPLQPGAVLATSENDLPVLASNLALNTGMRITLTLPVKVSAGLGGGTQITNSFVVTSVEAPARSAETVVTVKDLACVPIASVDLTASPAGDLTAGATVRFLADVQGGTRPLDFDWTLDDAPLTTAGEVYEHTFADAGDYGVTVTATNACSAKVATITTTVLPAAAQQPDLSASQLWVSRSTAESGDVLTYTLILRNQSPVTATATVTNTRPNSSYAFVIPGSEQASDGGDMDFEEDYWIWSGEVVSGTPVLLTYAVTVGTPPEGTVLQNVAHIDDGAGRIVMLDAETIIAPEYGLLIDDGAPYTNSPTVTLTYAWNHTTVITEANLGSCSGSVCKNSGWLLLPTTVTTATYTPWSLDVSGDQRLLYTAWVLYRNGAGETVGPFYDTILYDPAAPAIAGIEVITTTGEMRTMADDSAVTVRVTTSDANSGVGVLHVSRTADFGSFTVVPVSGPTTDFGWTLASEESVYVRAVDRAGNVSAGEQVGIGGDDDYVICLPLVVRQTP